MFLVGAVCLFAARRRLEGLMRVPMLGLAMVAYVAFVSCVFFGNPRFAFPVIPFMAMYAGALLVMVWCALKQTSPAPIEAPGSVGADDYSQT
jgi:peptidoglycan/LPS O-acetylase OafA/YrhL